MAPLNVVALISGGKDSFFSILHCLEHGHSVVALANLFPPPVNGTIVGDSDSFMYQTIGHEVIPLYEKALGLPLYRQAIDGHAVSQTKTYEPSHTTLGSDETEALVPLLHRVLQAHPEVNAVSTGAILSDYQRTRVESVALRLGLTPISYLWQYPRIVNRSPVSLLEDMAAVGQDSRIIKVASGGLDSGFLWKNVASQQTMHRLLKASHRFGSTDDGAALGEGGEYESLAISGPAPLWKCCIISEEADREVIPGAAGSAALRVSRPSLGAQIDNVQAPLPQPDLLDEHFQKVFDELAGQKWKPDVSPPLGHPEYADALFLEPSVQVVDQQTIFLGAQAGQGLDAAEQMQSTLDLIKNTLAANHHNMTDIAYTSIILRDMADFPKINSVYAATFTRPNPPARATIACAGVLRPGQHISISVSSTTTSAPQQRVGLHVQSISYWAPANVGPYSQAITVPAPVSTEHRTDATMTYIAGQIPLIPATMALDSVQSEHELTFLHQAVLSLQHLHRIASVERVKSWRHIIAFMVAAPDTSAIAKAGIARIVWKRSYGHENLCSGELDDEDEAFDIWHSRFGSNRPLFGAQGSSSDFGSGLLSASSPDLVVIRVDSLPRNASIEWVAFGSNVEGPAPELNHYRHLLDVFACRII